MERGSLITPSLRIDIFKRTRYSISITFIWSIDVTSFLKSMAGFIGFPSII